jgi:glycogen synthase
MEEIARLQASRRGHKSHLKKVLNKANEILKVEPSKADEIALTTLKTTLEQLTRKQQLVRELDEKIAAKITDPKKLETEIYESEELSLSCDLEEKLNHIRKYIELCSLSSQSNQFTQGNQASTSTQSLETQATTQEIQESPSQVIN